MGGAGRGKGGLELVEEPSVGSRRTSASRSSQNRQNRQNRQGQQASGDKRGKPVGAKSRPLVLPESAERVLVTVDDAARRLSIGRATCYKLVMRGAIRSILIGRLRRIPVEALEEFAARQISA